MTHGIEIIKRMNEQASQPPKPTGTAEAAAKAASLQRANKRCLEPGELTRVGDTYIDVEGRHQLFGPTGWEVTNQEIYRDIPDQSDPSLAAKEVAIRYWWFRDDQMHAFLSSPRLEAKSSPPDAMTYDPRIIAAAREVEGLRELVDVLNANNESLQDFQVTMRSALGLGADAIDDEMIAAAERLTRERDEARHCANQKQEQASAWEAVYDKCCELGMDTRSIRPGLSCVIEFIQDAVKERDEAREKAAKWDAVLDALQSCEAIKMERIGGKIRCHELVRDKPSEPDAPEGNKGGLRKEKERRIYWQGLAYAGMDLVDSIAGNQVSKGHGVTEEDFPFAVKMAMDKVKFLKRERDEYKDKAAKWDEATKSKLIIGGVPLEAEPSEPDAPTDTPDPGEGWELFYGKDFVGHCSKIGDQYWFVNSWQDVAVPGSGYGRSNIYRRRIVMTQPPSEEAVGNADYAWYRCSADGAEAKPPQAIGTSIRLFWGYPNYIAWCHKLPGETEPPQMLRDWKPDELESVKDWCGTKTMQVGGDKVSDFKPAEPTTQRREWWLDEKTGSMFGNQVFDIQGDPQRLHVREILPGDPTPEEVAELRTLSYENDRLNSELAKLRRERDELRMELITSHGETQTALEERDALQARVDAAEEVARLMERWCNQATDVTELCTVHSKRAPRDKYVGLAVGLLKRKAAKLRGEG